MSGTFSNMSNLLRFNIISAWTLIDEKIVKQTPNEPRPSGIITEADLYVYDATAARNYQQEAYAQAINNNLICPVDLKDQFGKPIDFMMYHRNSGTAVLFFRKVDDKWDTRPEYGIGYTFESVKALLDIWLDEFPRWKMQ
jgi:hypothetical protein